MTPSVLVLGGGGMLGHKAFQTLSARLDGVRCTVRGKRADPPYCGIPLFQSDAVLEGVDAMDLPRLEGLLSDLKPSVIVNCIGIVKQRSEAVAAIPSITINSLLPHRLAAAAEAWGGRVIHFSTDCVFSGKDGNYTEESPSDAEDLYGKSKFLGEVAGANALTLRTSIIGRELSQYRSLLEWFLSQRGKTVRGYTRHFYSGLTTNQLAKVVADLIEMKPQLAGVFQVTSDVITKHDLLGLIRDAYGLDINIVPDGEGSCDRSMRGDRFREATGFCCPSWPDMVRQMADDTTPYDVWSRQDGQPISGSGDDPK